MRPEKYKKEISTPGQSAEAIHEKEEVLNSWKANASQIELLLTDVIMPGGFNGGNGPTGCRETVRVLRAKYRCYAQLTITPLTVLFGFPGGRGAFRSPMHNAASGPVDKL